MNPKLNNFKKSIVPLLIVLIIIGFTFRSSLYYLHSSSFENHFTENNKEYRDIEHVNSNEYVRLHVGSRTDSASVNKKTSFYLSKQTEGVVGYYLNNEFDNPFDNIFDIQISERLNPDLKVWLCYKLTGISDFGGVVCSVNDRFSFGGYLIKTDTATSKQRIRINPRWLSSGDNQIKFGIAPGARYGYKITELAIEVEQTHENAANEIIVINSTSKCYSGSTYIHGFLDNPKDAVLKINSEVVELFDGEFEIIANSNSDTMVVELLSQNKHFRKLVTNFKHSDVDYSFSIDANRITNMQLFRPEIDGLLKSELATIEVPTGSLNQKLNITLSDLRLVDLPSMGLGMSNVTVQKKGVRFLPHGEHFSGDGATVALKYDRTLIPDGYTEDDIRTFYFNPTLKKWEALQRDSINKDLCMVVSKTTHFTDMVNGVIQVPESPETQGFAPTMMSDIKAADPSSKINLIAPPTANNQGSANLSYPIEMPPARNGMSPQLSITYNSDAGSGWLGEGWDLNIPAITVDTRFGVPVYSSIYETETYSMGGIPLARAFIESGIDNDDEKMFFADRGKVYKRNTDQNNFVYQFYPKIEGSFQLVERIGNNPYDYKWRVTDKSGTKFYYGFHGAVLSKDTIIRANIAEWKLQGIVNLYGDSVAYTYSVDRNENSIGTLKSSAIYLSRIEGFTLLHETNSFKKHSEIEFFSVKKKNIRRSNARYGFLVSSHNLLDSLSIKYLNDYNQMELVRAYSFKYINGKFNSDLLSVIRQYDGASLKIAEHSFSYFDDIAESQNASYVNSNNLIITGPNDNVVGYNSIIGNISAAEGVLLNKKGILNNSKTEAFNANIYAGIGRDIKLFSKTNSFGINAACQFTWTNGKTMLLDINGDGVADYVFEDENVLYYLPGSIEGESYTFGQKTVLSGAPNSFLKVNGEVYTIGLAAYASIDDSPVSINGRVDWDIYNISKTKAYLADVNGDGLIDIVDGEKVYFNYLVDDRSCFSQNSYLTAKPMSKETIYDTSVPVFGLIRYDESKDDTIKANASPLQDIVRVWEAPYKGNITINGTIKLIPPGQNFDTLAYNNADGVRVAIQYGYNELWSLKIQKGDHDVKYSNATCQVMPGDRVFFRVQSGDSLTSNGDFDEVVWRPMIQYTNIDQSVDSFRTYDIYNKLIYSSNQGNIVSKLGYNFIDTVAPYTIKGFFSKPVTTSDVKLEIFSSNYPSQYPDTLNNQNKYVCNINYQHQLVTTFVFNKDEVYDNYCFSYTSPANNNHTFFWFRLFSPTDEKWDSIKCFPQIEYSYETMGVTRSDTVYAGVKYDINKSSQVNRSNQWKEGLQPYIPILPQSVKIRPIMWNSNSDNVSPDWCNPVNGQFQISSSNGFEKWFSCKYDFRISSSNNTFIDFYSGTSRPNCTFNLFIDEDTYKSNNFAIEIFNPSNQQTIYAYPTVYVKKSNNDFGTMWRGWGQFQYNAAQGRYSRPIEVDSLILPKDSNSIYFDNMCMIPLAPEAKNKKYWQGYSENVHLKGDTMKAGRLIVNNIKINSFIREDGPYRVKRNTMSSPTDSFSKYFISAPELITKNKSLSFGGGFDLDITNVLFDKLTTKIKKNLSFGFNDGVSFGSSEKILDYIDMNGDGFPDYFNNGVIHYSNSRGSETAIRRNQPNQLERNFSRELGVSFNVDNPTKDNTSNPSTTKVTLKSIAESATIKASVSLRKTVNQLDISFVDINGDGLPDMINHKDEAISLNLGYTFSDTVSFKTFQSNITNYSANPGLGVGIELFSGSIKAGFGISNSLSTTNKKLIDINGDGLVDIVSKKTYTDPIQLFLFNFKPRNEIYVRLNMGNGFSEDSILWAVNYDLESNVASTKSLNAAGGYGTLFAGGKLVFNLSAQYSNTSTRTLDDVRDIDGDGYPDFVQTNLNSNTLNVFKSNINRTNKLRSVVNPLGGQIIIGYNRTQPSSNHPGGKWVMSFVELNDGINNDGSIIRTDHIYEGGVYNRREKEFIGFADVTSLQLNTEIAGFNNLPDNLKRDNFLRKSVAQYDISSYYTKGNLLKSTVYNEENRKVSESQNKYYLYDVRTRRSINNNIIRDHFNYVENYSPSDSIVVYSPLNYSKTTIFGSSGDSLIINQSHYTYWVDYNSVSNELGDVKQFSTSNKGLLNSDGTGTCDYQTKIWYKNALNSQYYYGGIPTEVKVYIGNSSTHLIRHAKAYYTDSNSPIKPTKVSQITSLNGDSSITQLYYDKAGNITRKVLPAGMSYSYTYDDRYKMYLTQIQDTFGHISKIENYDYRFGIPLKTTDVNGNEMMTVVDNIGRITAIIGPNEIINSKPYTIKFDYFPQNVSIDNEGFIDQPAFAISKHYDQQYPNDNIETVTFIDGFGKPIQVNKDAYIDGQQQIITSGIVCYDPLDRTVKSYYPRVNSLTEKTIYKPREDNQPPTRMYYDALDRVTKTVLPDGATTEMTYGIAGGYLKTTVKDALQNIQETYTNGSGLTVKTTQYASANEPINTHFLYDPINQLIEVTDAMGKKTISEYDLVGRRVSVTHPASGKTTFEYDLSGNLIAKQTENLRKEGAHKKIRYAYTFNRLDSIIYPNHPENNVIYSYGNSSDNSGFNRKGRLVSLTDGSGRQEFKYGRQGELTELSRTLVIPNQGVANYVTQWEYDSWNRLKNMTYPDGEVVTYSYNPGGLLNKVTGTKSGTTTVHVDDIRYDKFEQRTLLKYGNGTQTDYTYNPLNRLMNTLKVQKGSTVLMNNAYTYDAVQNITGIVSSNITQGAIGGSMSHQYRYDNLNRLDSAWGSFVGPNSKMADYTLGLSYDNLHNITRKTQDIVQQNLKFNGILNSGYNLSYTYADNSQQIANIADASYRADRSGGAYSTGRQQTDVLNEKAQSFTYDANGNMTYVASGKKLNDSTLQATSTRKLLWDEENRLLAISDNGYVSNYWYDASGERTVKQSGGSEGVFVNGVLSGARTETGRFTAYISPYMVVSNGGNYSKHIYMGSQRIVSKLSNSGIFEDSPVTATDQQARYALQSHKIKERFDSLGVVYNGTAQTGGLISSIPDTTASSYFYHPDHLGSSSLITDGTGALTQHIQYVPFGEVFVEERTNSWSTPYKFNGKELDEETGLYYYHARYYDPRLSVWMSVDPLAEKYPNVSSYVYCANNPVKYVDPDGREWTYSKNANGKTHIAVGVNFVVGNDVSLNAEQVRLYQNAINTQFNNVLKTSSGGNFSGSVTFDGGNNSQQFTPTSYMNQSQNVLAGYESYGSFNVNLSKNDGSIKTPYEFALDYIHELLHTVRLHHPHEFTQSDDTKLVFQGGVNFLSTPTTDPNILFNIMLYDKVNIDGTTTTTNNMNRLTNGQIGFMLNQIDMQKQGYGIFIYNNNNTQIENDNNFNSFYLNYWTNFPGVPVQQ